MERLQKIIAARGMCSRRQAEQWISQGRVQVNGQPAQLGQKADETADRITVDGVLLPGMQENIYLMLHKPRGYVTTLSDEKGRKNAAQLVENCGARVYPVGRLDMDSEGLLIFTNDGDFANRLMHPRHEIRKIYRVWVGDYTPEKLENLKKPLELDGYLIQKPEISLVSSQDGRAVVDVTIHEGRNRQVRRMCSAAGLSVSRLLRIREGDLFLGELKCGQWRMLTPDEVRRLKQ